MFYISSSCIQNNRLFNMLSMLAKRNIKNIELSGGIKYQQNYEETILKLKEVNNLKLLIHNYFPTPKKAFIINLASSNSLTLSRTYALITKAIALARKLKINHYSIHPGFTTEMLPKLKQGLHFTVGKKSTQSRNSAINSFYNNLNYVISNILNDNFKLMIENTIPFCPPYNYAVLYSPLEIVGFLENYKDYPNIGLLLDLGHLNISSAMLGFNKMDFVKHLFSKYGNKVFEVHLSDNDGKIDCHNFTNSNSWQIKAIYENFYFIKNIPIVLEWQETELETVIKQYKKLTDIFKYKN